MLRTIATLDDNSENGLCAYVLCSIYIYAETIGFIEIAFYCVQTRANITICVNC